MPQAKSFLNNAFKKMSLPSAAKGLLYNKYVLYIVFATALINLLYETVNQDYLYSVLFILIGFITAFFNKNMIVILVITMALSFIVRAVLRGVGVVPEGFQEGATDKPVDVKTTASDKKGTSDKVTIEPSVGMMGCTSATSGTIKTQNAPKSTGADGKDILLQSLKTDAVELMSVQNSIISGFQTIEPAMDRAETLIQSIQDTAKTIDGLKERMKPQ
jgi:hypothetical protein